MQAKRRETGAFSNVNIFEDVGGTPRMLHQDIYDAVLIFGAEFSSDPAALGDRLTAYHDQGGVVMAGLSNCGTHATRRVRGTWGNPVNGYALLDYASGVWNNSGDSFGDLLEPQRPLVTGVVSLSASPYGTRTMPPLSIAGW